MGIIDLYKTVSKSESKSMNDAGKAMCFSKKIHFSRHISDGTYHDNIKRASPHENSFSISLINIHIVHVHAHSEGS